MAVVGVHAAVREQACQVQPAAAGLGLCDALQQNRIGKKIAVPDRFGDAGQVLVNDPAGADIEVADLGVAHLAVG